jgi:hypothetical protein
VRLTGCVIAKSVRHWLLTTRPRVRSLVSACEIHGGRNVTGANIISPSLFAFSLLNIIPPLLHTHLSPPSNTYVR